MRLGYVDRLVSRCSGILVRGKLLPRFRPDHKVQGDHYCSYTALHVHTRSDRHGALVAVGCDVGCRGSGEAAETAPRVPVITSSGMVA